jgi:hypothetical protein
MFWPIPSKPPTPSEYAVLIWAFVVLLVLAGLIGLAVSFSAPPEKHELAVALAHYSLGSLAVAIVIGFVLWLFRRFVD